MRARQHGPKLRKDNNNHSAFGCQFPKLEPTLIATDSVEFSE